MPGPALAQHLAEQADVCQEQGSSLYAALLRACVDDLAAGGPVRAVLADHLDAPRGAATGLRLLGGVHQLVLTGRAPRLARQYPSVGGRPDGDLVPAFLDTVATSAAELVDLMSGPPQTNEVGRAAALVGGLLHVLGGRPLPVRLHEIGSSGGLNLNADRFRYQQGPDGPWWGPPGSPVALADAWRGTVPPAGPLQVVERAGTDVAPVDLTDPAARVRLLSYVWADQEARVQRLRAALELAAAHPVPVEQTDAVTAVRRLRLRAGHLTVLWHSVMWQYMTADDQAAVLAALDELGATAEPGTPLLHLALEPGPAAADAAHRQPFRHLVVATTWPGGDRRVLGASPPHGVPTTWSC